MAHLSSFTLLDYSNEKSNVRLYNGAITSVNIAAFLTEFGQMRDAIDLITSGTIHKEAWIGDETLLSNTLPTNPFSQRELKWLVQYRDTTSNNLYTITLPTADPSGVDGGGDPRLVPGTDLANTANADIAAFITRFNSFARSPEADDHLVAVTEIRLVGRNI